MILTENDPDLEQHLERRNLWVVKARLLMLEENSVSLGRDEVESCLLDALELNTKHLEAIEETSYFYDAVVPGRANAVMYPQHYIPACWENCK